MYVCMYIYIYEQYRDVTHDGDEREDEEGEEREHRLSRSALLGGDWAVESQMFWLNVPTKRSH